MTYIRNVPLASGLSRPQSPSGASLPARNAATVLMPVHHVPEVRYVLSAGGDAQERRERGRAMLLWRSGCEGANRRSMLARDSTPYPHSSSPSPRFSSHFRYSLLAIITRGCRHARSLLCPRSCPRVHSSRTFVPLVHSPFAPSVHASPIMPLHRKTDAAAAATCHRMLLLPRPMLNSQMIFTVHNNR